MQYDVSSPKQYMESLESDWRKDKLQQLREIIFKQDSDIMESINYKMLCFKLGKTIVFHLNAQRGYVSLYCGNIERIDPTDQLLKGLNKGKGCVRFTKTKDVTQEPIEEFINKAVSLARGGVDLGCKVQLTAQWLEFHEQFT